MRISMSCAYKQAQPLVNSQRVMNLAPYFCRKEKVVFVVGPTGTGKSRLAIDLATHFPAEIINCDKIQFHKGLDIVTNKVTKEERRGVPHHLLGTIDPNANFTSEDFIHHASLVTPSILMRDRLPIVAGGSNSYIEALANNNPEFRMRYDCCFLWVDVSLPILNSFISERVDRMVKAGLVDEVRNMFDHNNCDYSQGIRRAIGVPELDYYFRNEAIFIDSQIQDKMLDKAITKIKENTCLLAYRQLKKIHKLHNQWIWNMHRIDATEVFLRSGEEADKAWEKLVTGPSTMIVNQFLYDHEYMATIASPDVVTSLPSTSKVGLPTSVPAMVAASTW